jgi:hypothetical protein
MVDPGNTAPPEHHNIEIETEGHTYKGHYILGQKMITVSLIGGGTTTTSWSAIGEPDALAKVILLELIARQALTKKPF